MTVDPTEKPVGVILAGGLSRRMGGGDKGLLDLGGMTMLSHVISAFRPQVAELVLNANGDADRFAQFGLPVVADPVDGFVGPLAGILAGLTWAAQHAPDARYIATVSSDAPFLPPDLVARLSAELQPGGAPKIVSVASGGREHPILGLWPVALAGNLADALQDGLRKVDLWTARHDQSSVHFEPRQIGGCAVDPFFNANTPEELEEARSLLGVASAQ
ncbi:MAG: molybdenum cofactor guanylyltransferase MobA [Pseudomonadota bacterium]